jgi:hypothetical protein
MRKTAVFSLCGLWIMALTAAIMVAPPCMTMAKVKPFGGFLMDCPIISEGAGSSLCNYHSERDGDLWIHSCQCDNGAPNRVCNGTMESFNSDPSQPGISVHCPEVDCPVAEGGGDCTPVDLDETCFVYACECK